MSNHDGTMVDAERDRPGLAVPDLSRHRRSRRWFVHRAAAVGLSAPFAGTLLSACGGGSSAPTATTASGASTATAASAATAIPTSPPAPAASAATPAASPTSSPATPAAVKNATFTIVDGIEPNSLDPCVGTGAWQSTITAMFETLVLWTPQMQVEPLLATSWEVSADHKSWIFKLRPNVTFHDGTPFNSAAVKATVAHILDTKTLATRRSSYTLIKEVQTPDDLTAVFVTDPPNPDFPFLLADGSANISSPAAYQKYGQDYGRNPVGTGPFKFEEWVANDHISMLNYPDYWGEKAQVRRFVFKPVPEAAARSIMLKTGEADVVLKLAPADIAELQKDPNLTITVSPGLTVVTPEMKQTKPPFSIKEVRYALNQAIDKEAIINNVMQGFAKPLKTPSCPGLWGTYEFDIPPYDPAKAKQLLAGAGYPDGIDVTLGYTAGSWAGDDQVAQAMQGYWSQIGVRTTIRKTDQATATADGSADPDTRPGWIRMPLRLSNYTDYHLYRMYQTDATHANSAQRSGYSNPEVDKLLDQERTIFEPDKRLPIFKQIQQLLWDDQPFVYLFSLGNLWGQRKNVSGFTMQPDGTFYQRGLKKT